MKDQIAHTVKEQLRYVVDSFAGVLSFDIDERLSEEENVATIISQTALVCAVVAIVNPIPFLDLVVLTPIHAKMTLHIGKAKGFSISQERALEVYREVVTAIGASVLGAALASLVKLVPIIGLLVFVPIIYGATYGIGQAVTLYFDGQRSGSIPTAASLAELFKRELKIGKAKGATIGRGELDRAYRELKAKVEERERAKESARAERQPEHEPEPEPEKHAPGTSGNPVTPSRITIRERPVRKPTKTIGEDADALPSPVEKPEPAPPAKPAFVPEKTIGPETPYAGTVSPLAPAPAPAAAPAPAPLPAMPAITASAPAAVNAPATKVNLVDELERLAKLRDLGALTPEEFDLAKKKLLS